MTWGNKCHLKTDRIIAAAAKQGGSSYVFIFTHQKVRQAISSAVLSQIQDTYRSIFWLKAALDERSWWIEGRSSECFFCGDPRQRLYKSDRPILDLPSHTDLLLLLMVLFSLKTPALLSAKTCPTTTDRKLLGWWEALSETGYLTDKSWSHKDWKINDNQQLE